jgi:hypothetical protein
VVASPSRRLPSARVFGPKAARKGRKGSGLFAVIFVSFREDTDQLLDLVGSVRGSTGRTQGSKQNRLLSPVAASRNYPSFADGSDNGSRRRVAALQDRADEGAKSIRKAVFG